MKLFKPFFFIFTAAVMFSACKKESKDPEFDSPATKLSGKVILEEKYGGIKFDERAGTQVLLNAEFNSFPATTDNSGRYEYSGIDDGSYSVTVSREGFTTMQIHGIQFSRNSPNLPVQGEYQQLPTITLGTKSVSYFDSTMVTPVYNWEIVFQDTINDTLVTEIDTLSANILFRSLRVGPHSQNPDAKFGYRLFVGKTANVGPNNYLATYHGITVLQQEVIEKVWTQEEWQNLGFDFEENFYVKIYGDAVNPLSYEAPGGVTVFPNLSDSLGVDAGMVIPFN